MPDTTIWQSSLIFLGAAFVFGYLLGSIPFGLILTRMAGLGDVRSIGSGNIGATNVLRTGSKKLAAATLVLDALKGTLAVIVAASFGFDLAIVAGFAAFLGHLFPAWLGFRGGKGVATYIGVLLGLVPVMVLVFAVVWIGVALITRFSSLAALIAMVATTLVIYFAGHGNIAGLFAIMTVISYIKHRKNIARLIAGTESRIGAKG